MLQCFSKSLAGFFLCSSLKSMYGFNHKDSLHFYNLSIFIMSVSFRDRCIVDKSVSFDSDEHIFHFDSGLV